jgi:hypothetical protein
VRGCCIKQKHEAECGGERCAAAALAVWSVKRERGEELEREGAGERWGFNGAAL